MARVLVDTNVLFPFSLMDLMLALTEDAVHTLVWSDHLPAEWERVIVRERQRSAPAATRISAAIKNSSPMAGFRRTTTNTCSIGWKVPTRMTATIWPLLSQAVFVSW
ncbi:hypothetical protein ABZ470_32275 [Streptosporangium sp. NPDC020072]|uniref:hypothetical protein n=1 Tax=Streptosporangium sp. NPDC020072 TaxID=3154788 RepID=UPI003437082E